MHMSGADFCEQKRNEWFVQIFVSEQKRNEWFVQIFVSHYYKESSLLL